MNYLAVDKQYKWNSQNWNFYQNILEKLCFIFKKIIWFPGSTTYHERDGSETSSQFNSNLKAGYKENGGSPQGAT